MKYKIPLTTIAFVALIGSIAPIIQAAPPEAQKTSKRTGYEAHRADDAVQGCGLRRPTIAEWTNGTVEQFGKWMDYNWENYKSSNYTTFMGYMLGEFAPEAPASALECDGLGSCSIGSCENIAKDLDETDRRMAYYAFEQIANIDHTYQIIYAATTEASGYIYDGHAAILDSFSYAGVIQEANQKRRRTQQVATSIVTTTALLITGALAVANTGLVSAWLTEFGMAATLTQSLNSNLINQGMNMVNGAYGLATNAYIGFNIAAHAWHNEQDVPGAATNLFENFFNSLAHMKVQQVWKELHQIMDGKTSENATSLSDLLKSGAFIERNEALREKLTDAIEKAFLAVAIDTFWSLDRAYILDTDEDGVPCTSDKRGPPRNRVCLPERPGRIYWVYVIDSGKEGDKLHRANAMVRSPMGLKKLVDHPENFRNITKENIVRASLWAQENKFVNDAGPLMSKLPILWFANGSLVGGDLAGTFTLPVCRNPHGEAISSVWARRGRNYPCMCGEFSWAKDGGYNLEKDETKAFLLQTGFFGSEDWPFFCSMGLHCKKDKNIDYHWDKIPSAPNQIHAVKHPYKFCKKPTPHSKYPPNNKTGNNPQWIWGHPENDK